MTTSLAKQLRVALGLAALSIMIGALANPYFAYAGPPLICHPLNIGNARSLPSGDGPFGTKKDYNRELLIEETLDLLTPDMPIIVRMETLRRATIYAAGINKGKGGWSNHSEGNRRIAYELLSRLMARALSREAHNKYEAMAWFDVGYLMECYQQVGLGKDLSGYDFLRKALSLRGEDPEIEFACALVTVWPKRSEHNQHLQKAKAGARDKSLLTTNITIHFRNEQADQ
jgi:hypothetical protein